MARLRGNAEGTMDAKGRATVPAKFRPMFEGGQELVLWEPQGLSQPYLVLCSEDYFNRIYEREYAQAAPAARQDLLHDMLGHMDEMELDAASRFVIPEKYCDKAGLQRGEKLFFLANIEYIEIWSLQVWKAREARRRQERSLMDYTPTPALAVPPTPAPTTQPEAEPPTTEEPHV